MTSSCLLACPPLPSGELCVEAGVPGSLPTAPSGVSDLRCEVLQLGHDAGSSGGRGHDNPSAAVLAAMLQWQVAAAGVRCCHVWCVFEDGAAGTAAEPCWLGVACTGAFCVSGLAVLAGASAVTFLVQPEGRNGLVQELASAARVSVSIEQHTSAAAR